MMRLYRFMLIPTLGALCPTGTFGQTAGSYPITPLPFTAVQVADSFWLPRLTTNRTVTIPYAFKLCEETGRIANFARAGKLEEGPFQGIFFNDSDVFKVIEGAAYSLSLAPDAELDRYLDDLIAKIAAAQEPDGYLYTARTIDPSHPPESSGPTRWSNLVFSHELYNLGHLYEAAVAHHVATGKDNLLDVAIKSADLVAREFGPGRRTDVPGHQEIEIGLARLYRLTGNPAYLDTARFFLDQRGNAAGHQLYGPYAQDHLPVTRQTEPVGHAVRAVYMYCGMADVATLTGSDDYTHAIDRIWDTMTARRLYLTGGIGARHSGEAFGDDYELPNASAYCETCAAIANAFWNYRMFLLHADARYIDVLERVLYNGLLSGVSLSGDQFFYTNPLASRGDVARQPWFGCACCPTNLVRFLPSIPGYVYACQGDRVYVNLFISGTATVPVGEGRVGDAAGSAAGSAAANAAGRAGESEAGRYVKLTQSGNYPWAGTVSVSVETEEPVEFTLCVRIPGWATGQAVPSDLYTFADGAAGAGGTDGGTGDAADGDAGGQPADAQVTLKVNGAAIPLDVERGYARIQRTWQSGDRVTLDLPMPIRRIHAHPQIGDDVGRVALQRGPLVYCAEGVDNGGHVSNFVLPDDATLHAELRPDLLGGIVVLRGTGQGVYEREHEPGRERSGDDRERSGDHVEVRTADFTAVPYYAWCHRAPGEMAVWFARTPAVARPWPRPTLATNAKTEASFVGNGTLTALNDQWEAEGSGDRNVPRFTWWSHKGTTESVQYDFAEPTSVSRVEVYWFDDTGAGDCRLPASWRLLYRDGDNWLPVTGAASFGCEADQYNAVTFDSVKTTGLQLEVQLQAGFSGGILEWRVH